MHKTIHDLYRSFRYISYFYVPLFFLGLIAMFLLPEYGRNANLAAGALIVFLGSLFVVVVTQISNYVIEKYDIRERTREFLYINFADCFFRCSAGLGEMVLYTVAFSLKLEAVVAGYLLLKTVSIWQDNVRNKKEGLHTAILRFAIVCSLLISLAASAYLRKTVPLNL